MKVVEQNIVNAFLVTEEELFNKDPIGFIPTLVPSDYTEEMEEYVEYQLEIMFDRYEKRVERLKKSV